MRTKFLALAAVALAAAGMTVSAMPPRMGPGPWNHWGYTGDQRPGFICVIPPPPGFREPFSRTTLILSLDEGMNHEKLVKLCGTYDLKILYEYKNFSMAAVAAQHPLTDKEMADLMAKLSTEPGVTQVMRDRVMHLDGPGHHMMYAEVTVMSEE